MWFRRLFYHWLIPAAFVLPLWLLLGWGVFGASGWALLWVLPVAMPSVFVGQLIFGLLIRARGTVRADRAVSWQDVVVMGTWHVLTIAVGTYPQAWFGLLLTGAIAFSVVTLWSSLGQLWNEARGRAAVFVDPGFTPTGAFGPGAAGAQGGRAADFDGQVFVVTEKQDGER